MYHIDITEPAEQDIQSAVNYIAIELQNKAAAIRLYDDVYKAIISLEDNPFRYAHVRNETLAGFGIR